MDEYTLRLPDIGEGIAEAELVEWNVKPGDLVREDAIVASVMTDKATVEIPAPVSGTVTWLGAEVGDKVAVKGPLMRLALGGAAGGTRTKAAPEPAEPAPLAEAPAAPAEPEREAPAMRDEPAPPQSRPAGAPALAPAKALASPAVRRRALDAGLDIGAVEATGPAGRVTHEDLDRHLRGGERAGAPAPRRAGGPEVEEIRITGLRRRIAERMTLAASRIPHITYVEEVDMTALEELRAALNRDRHEGRDKLTILPFLMKAIARAVEAHPVVNATFDDEAGIVSRHRAVHVGVATQTPSGLMVPVVRHVETRDLWDCSREMARVTGAAREGGASREELTGSTITVSSLGALGGLVSTPIINHPEVAIVGVNKLTSKPHWNGSSFVPRAVMNLSSSFDHRIVDGWDAARFIQRVKALLEVPATLFMED